jgi:hypothetical protein
MPLKALSITGLRVMATLAGVSRAPHQVPRAAGLGILAGQSEAGSRRVAKKRYLGACLTRSTFDTRHESGDGYAPTVRVFLVVSGC